MPYTPSDNDPGTGPAAGWRLRDAGKIWRNDNRFDNDEIRQQLRTLGTYPEPHAVLMFLNERFP